MEKKKTRIANRITFEADCLEQNAFLAASHPNEYEAKFNGQRQ